MQYNMCIELPNKTMNYAEEQLYKVGRNIAKKLHSFVAFMGKKFMLVKTLCFYNGKNL